MGGTPFLPMETDTSAPTSTPRRRRRWPWVAAVLVVAVGAGVWWWSSAAQKADAQAARRPAGATPVVTARAEARDVAVKIKANGTVTALQSVDLRSQVTSTVREVHIREGQNVHKGDLLFSLDARADDANIRKAEAQVAKDRADLATAARNLERQRELFTQKFISQSALDTAQNQVDTLNGQLAVDQAALESTRVARGYTEIRASFAGRTGTIGVRAGSLVQPNGSVLVTVAQIDPVAVSFTLPETELPGLQSALKAGAVAVSAKAQRSAEEHKGRVTFVDNSVDTATGTIRVKAEFDNAKAALWPGMYVNVEMAPRTLAGATVVPTQAVQTGPENRFVYVVGEDGKVVARTVQVAYLEETFAAVSGVRPGDRVVTEGAQNLRPGGAVVEANRSQPDAGKGAGKKGKKAS